jgi:hypothetical protein
MAKGIEAPRERLPAPSKAAFWGEYGPIEDDCNLLEERLGRDEYELTKLEENFTKRQSEEPQNFSGNQQSQLSDPDEALAIASILNQIWVEILIL